MLISRNLFKELLNIVCHIMEKREFYCHANFFSSKQFRVKFFGKTVNFAEFLQKIVAEKSWNFHTTVWKNKKFTATQIFFRQINLE